MVSTEIWPNIANACDPDFSDVMFHFAYLHSSFSYSFSLSLFSSFSIVIYVFYLLAYGSAFKQCHRLLYKFEATVFLCSTNDAVEKEETMNRLLYAMQNKNHDKQVAKKIERERKCTPKTAAETSE